DEGCAGDASGSDGWIVARGFAVVQGGLVVRGGGTAHRIAAVGVPGSAPGGGVLIRAQRRECARHYRAAADSRIHPWPSRFRTRSSRAPSTRSAPTSTACAS